MKSTTRTIGIILIIFYSNIIYGFVGYFKADADVNVNTNIDINDEDLNKIIYAYDRFPEHINEILKNVDLITTKHLNDIKGYVDSKHNELKCDIAVAGADANEILNDLIGRLQGIIISSKERPACGVDFDEDQVINFKKYYDHQLCLLKQELIKNPDKTDYHNNIETSFIGLEESTKYLQCQLTYNNNLSSYAKEIYSNTLYDHYLLSSTLDKLKDSCDNLYDCAEFLLDDLINKANQHPKTDQSTITNDISELRKLLCRPTLFFNKCNPEKIVEYMLSANRGYLLIDASNNSRLNHIELLKSNIINLSERGKNIFFTFRNSNRVIPQIDKNNIFLNFREAHKSLIELNETFKYKFEDHDSYRPLLNHAIDIYSSSKRAVAEEIYNTYNYRSTPGAFSKPVIPLPVPNHVMTQSILNNLNAIDSLASFKLGIHLRAGTFEVCMSLFGDRYAVYPANNCLLPTNLRNAINVLMSQIP